eukprot:296979-Amorphochlora_amoeboformis.AAC.1
MHIRESQGLGCKPENTEGAMRIVTTTRGKESTRREKQKWLGIKRDTKLGGEGERVREKK